MKRGCVFGLLAAIAMNVQAQSSSRFYGVLDIGVDYVSAATPEGRALVRVTSGGANTSRWGFRGKEDLGDGLAAVYQLEGSLLLDTGGGDSIFRRQANAGLEGQFGRVVFGRSFTTVHDLVTVFDPMALAQFYSWSVSASATGPNKYGYTTSFDNMVKYLGTVGSAQVGINYGFGEQGGNRHDSAKLALSFTHRVDGFSSMATWEAVNGNRMPASGGREKSEVAHLGLMYQHGAYRWTAVARRYRLSPSAPSSAEIAATTSWAGLNHTMDTSTLTAALYHVNVAGGPAAGARSDPTMLVLSYRHGWSPRTDTYAVLSCAKARHGLPAGVLRDIGGYGNSQRGLALGMQHRF